jgi:hypothetical protein
MSPRVKYGLIVGAVIMFVNLCVAAALPICGPMMALLAGAVAGYLTAREEEPAAAGDGARAGAVSGLIAGALVFLGQLIGGIGALVFLQTTDIPTGFGAVPDLTETFGLLGFWVAGLALALCLGLSGLVLGALGGAIAGYLAAPSEEAVV